MLPVAAAVLALVACNNAEKEAKDFAAEFLAKAKANDVSAVRSMYPDAVRCDSFAVDYTTDQITMEEKDGQYTVTFGDRRTFVLAKGDDGQLRVVSSTGVFAYDTDLLDFARRTGWTDSRMNDGALAERLSDRDFLDAMVSRFADELKSKVVGGEVDYFAQSYADQSSLHAVVTRVTNRTDFDIPGDVYQVAYRSVYWGFPEDNETTLLNGVDIPANGSVTIRGRKRSAGEPTESSVRVKFDEQKLLRLCLQQYKANGHEYRDYKDYKEKQ